MPEALTVESVTESKTQAPPEPILVRLEFTPNPNTLKFVVNRDFMERGAANFTSVDQAEHSPLAQAVFKVVGVQAVLIGTNFITVTKSPDGSWDVLADDVPKTIETQLKTGAPAFDKDWKFEVAAPSSGSLSEVEQKIKTVLDNEIRPAVAMDGGDITFGKYEDGIVYLHLQGSCSSCPSSIATLRMGVETRLKEVVPEIKEVVQI